jgi:hypothetical protein
MSTYPTSPRSDFIEWCAAQAPEWNEDPDAIGLTKTQASEFVATADKAQTALVELEQARQAALVAADKARAVVALLRRQAGEAVRSIRSYAELSPDAPKIYATARIAPPAGPTPMPPPGRPTRMNATLEAATGALTLTWKSRHPSGVGGTTYLVRRRLPGETAFTLLGTVGKKTFVDDALPAGVAGVEYTVQGQRGSRVGALSAILSVSLGKPDGKVVKHPRQRGTAEGAALMAGGRMTAPVLV